MENLTSHTINEQPDFRPTHLFDNILTKVERGLHWLFIYDSFEQYYYVLKQAIAHYEELENYEACAVLAKNLKDCLKKIPKNVNEAVDYLVESTPETHRHLFKGRNTFSLAINLHKTTGMRIIDLWVLRFEDSPLRQHYSEVHGITNHDEIANDILIKYIDAVKDVIKMG